MDGKLTEPIVVQPRRPRRATRGYTIVEVMMALAILTVGMMGIVAFQRSTIVGTTQARNLAAANAVAAAWAERLRFDAMQWTDVGGVPNIASTTAWLAVVGEDFPTRTGQEAMWFQPLPMPAFDISPMADLRGRDTFNANEAQFCTHLRLTQLMPSVVRAEIRVFWRRQNPTIARQGLDPMLAGGFCQDNPAYIDAVGARRDIFHTIYMTTAVARNDSIR